MDTRTTLPVLSEDVNRDLGFGSVISREKLRLLNRDGTFNVARKGLGFWRSLSIYHSLLTMPSWEFMGVVLGTYGVANLIFATAYFLAGPGTLRSSSSGLPPDGFLQAFFFSVHTFSTIGYGNILPVGIAANVIVSIESMVGLLGLALATGLLFARFSRPTAKIIYSASAVIAPYHDITAFEFRITNGRSNELIEVAAKVIFSRFEEENGGPLRRYYPLELERSKVAFFPLSWTVVHPINSSSPLNGLTQDQLLKSNAEFLILLTGIDETFSQTVHSRSSYKAEEIAWGAKFSNIFEPSASAQTVAVDLERFHSIERAG